MKKVLISESAYHRLLEMGGVYPDGQVDMFFDQDGVDEYRSSANGRAIDALLKAEKECMWKHSATKDMGKYIEYVCYPVSDYMSKDREEFMGRIKAYAPIKDNITFSTPRNSFTKVFNVRIKNI
jgi:hypothetical protein